MASAIIDFRTSEEEIDSLKSLGYNIIKCPQSNRLYSAVCGHPDMQLFLLDKKNIIVHKDMESAFLDELISCNLNIIYSSNRLEETYPQDIILNSLILGDIFIHKISATDPNLLCLVKNKIHVNVKQGYTKCSTAIVSHNAAITSDKGICSSLSNQGLDILLLPPGDIDLPGLDYGFIGGTCGLLDETTLAFFGELEHYAYGKYVLDFLKYHGVKPVYLKKGRLTDRGTLFTVP